MSSFPVAPLTNFMTRIPAMKYVAKPTRHLKGERVIGGECIAVSDYKIMRIKPGRPVTSTASSWWGSSQLFCPTHLPFIANSYNK